MNTVRILRRFVSAEAIKDLRVKTGAPMVQCKEALTQCNGDVDAAINWLRKQGVANAAKKSTRTASSGCIGVAISGNHGVLVEVPHAIILP